MATYSIKDIEKMSGIKAHTIRMWERRYGIVVPKRTDSNIRYYSDEDLRNLLNISILNQNGMKISKIAELDRSEIREEVSNLLRNSEKGDHIIHEMLFAMMELNEYAFNQVFNKGLKEYEFEKLIELVVFPFLHRIGVLWQTETVRAAQEHFVSNLLRQKMILAIESDTLPQKNLKNKIIFFLPEHEMHELSLLFYSYIARKEQFEVIYLGASVPIMDLKEVQKVTKATAFFAAFTTAVERKKLKEMFSFLRTSFPHCSFYVTGYQIKELRPTLPKDFYAVSSAADFRIYLKKHRKTG